MPTPINQLKREAIADREVFTVQTWRFTEHRFLFARSFGTSAEAWDWVHERQRAGDFTRVRVLSKTEPAP